MPATNPAPAPATAAQAARVERVCGTLHTELRLPHDAMLRVLPAVLRAPHFVQVRRPSGLRRLHLLGALLHCCTLE